jgi:prepilin-type N-terminal cleavage/methylation domain-containing protein
MLNRIRNRQKGFTLIELLIVVAIIGIIAALLIPNFLDALQKAKQKRTVGDMRSTGTAMFSWLTDQLSAAAAGQGVTTVSVSNYATGALTSADTIDDVLVPRYIQVVPPQDGWKSDFVYYLKTGTNVLDEQVMLIGSGGKNKAFDGGEYVVSGFDPTDYDQDIVWADGFFVRWPQGVTGATAP